MSSSSPRPARERLVTSMIAAMRRRGVHGTGIAEVLEHSSTARGSIYQHFPGGKEELVATATTAAGAFIEQVSSVADPHTHVDERVDWWIRQCHRHDFALGCPIAAAALAGPQMPTVTEAARTVFDSWVGRFGESLTSRGVPECEALSLARFFVSSIEGAIMQARVRRDVAPLSDVRDQMHRLLDLVIPPGPVA